MGALAMMRAKKYSLKWRLVISIATAFILIWAVAFVWLYVNLERKMTEALDERLSASAHMVARLLSQIPVTQLSDYATPVVSELNQQNLIACEVSLFSSDLVIDHNIVARTRGAPAGLAKQAAGFSTWTEHGVTWRSYSLKREPLQVVAAEKVILREQLLIEILQSILWPLILTLIFCLGLVQWIIKKQFQPIEQTTQFLKLHKDQLQRGSDSIHQLQSTNVPLELHSFIEHLSDLVSRLQQSLENEKNFSAFAAHELRSPLTAIKVHVQLSQMIATQADVPASLTESLSEAADSIVRYQRLLEQLLLLSQTEHHDQLQNSQNKTAVELDLSLKHILLTLADTYTDIEQRVDVNWASLKRMYLPEQALRMVLLNLIENSLKHAQSSQPIQIYQQQHQLIIADFGVGLSLEELQLAKKRFWRKSAQNHGYGLGLALADSLLERNGYQLHLEANQPQGLKAVIALKPNP